MKSKTLILMVVAVSCGLAASYMTSRLLAERAAGDTDEHKVTVLVTKQSVSMGTLIKEPEKLFTEKEFISGQEPKNALRSYDELRNRKVNKPLGSEVHVTKDDLMDEKAAGFDIVMPPGTRAIAIRVNPETLAGGFVLPNSRVDILHTVRGGEGGTYSSILLQNMLVLACDTVDQRNPDQRAMLAGTVTLAATPEESQKLSLAAQLGELRLVLRKFDDNVAIKSKPVRPSDIARPSTTLGGDNPGEGEEGVVGPGNPWATKIPDAQPTPVVEDKKPEPVPTPPKTHTLVILNGESVTKAVYVLDDAGKATSTDVQKSRADHEEPSAKRAKDVAKEKEEGDVKKDGEGKDANKEPAKPEQGKADKAKAAPTGGKAKVKTPAAKDVK